MLFSSKSPYEKRAQLKKNLRNNKLLRFPGAFSPLVAMMIEKLGFDGVYVSGAVLSNDLGYPDIGLTTLSEVSSRGSQMARVTSLPTLIDIDTGFGETINVARTVQTLIEQGLCGCHLEDQVNPKRCGHLDHKVLVDTSCMVQKIKSARQAKTDPNFLVIARTDARQMEGFEKAVKRAKSYRDAGADMIFPESLKSKEEFAAFKKALGDTPLMANMTEFGHSPLLSAKELEDLGYHLVIYPVTTLRLAMKSVKNGLKELKEKGTQKNMLDKMQERKELYELLEYEMYNTFDKDIYNFKL